MHEYPLSKKDSEKWRWEKRYIIGNAILVHFNSIKELFIFFLVAQHFVSNSGKNAFFLGRDHSLSAYAVLAYRIAVLYRDTILINPFCVCLCME